MLELKRYRDSRHIPVVALTGYDTPGMRESALKAGYNDYITKPIDARKVPGSNRQNPPPAHLPNQIPAVESEGGSI